MYQYKSLFISTTRGILIFSPAAVGYKGNLDTDANAKGPLSIAIGSKNTSSSGIGSIAMGDGLSDHTKSEQNSQWQ